MIEPTGSSLQGKRIVITRPADQSSEMLELIHQRGGEAYLFPLIEVRPLEASDEWGKSLEMLPTYDAILFTSVNAVRFFYQKLQGIYSADQYKDVQKIVEVKMLAAVGPKTAEAIEQFGFNPEALPNRYQQEGLRDLLLQKLPDKAYILYPRANDVRPQLVQTLEEAGHIVHQMPIYETVKIRQGAQKRQDVQEGQDDLSFVDDLAKGNVDVMTFTSSSTVDAYVQMLQEDNVFSAQGQEDSLINACIGPITAERAMSNGLTVQVVAKEHTSLGLIQALEQYFDGHGFVTGNDG